MNNCVFTGYLTNDPAIDRDEASDCCVFKMVTYNYVRNKRGEKKRYPTTLTFEAWDSGARTIVKLAQKGTKMTVYCSARNGFQQRDSQDDIRFRVNEFDFACLDKE